MISEFPFIILLIFIHLFYINNKGLQEIGRLDYPLGIVCGGSGNGLCKSILFESNQPYGEVESVYSILKGILQKLDCQLVSGDGMDDVMSFLCLSFGVISNIDLDSEGLRWMGETRFTLWGVYEMLRNQTYPAKVWIKPASSLQDMTVTDEMLELPPLDVPLSHEEGWRCLEDSYSFVWVLVTSHSSSSVYSAPTLTLTDGEMMVVLLKDEGRMTMTEVLLGLDNGDHVNNDKVSTFG